MTTYESPFHVFFHAWWLMLCFGLILYYAIHSVLWVCSWLGLFGR